MSCFHAVGALIGKVISLALLGFVILILAGPILGIVAALFSVVIALLSIVLPFALVGFVAWGIAHILSSSMASSKFHKVHQRCHSACHHHLFPKIRKGTSACLHMSKILTKLGGKAYQKAPSLRPMGEFAVKAGIKAGEGAAHYGPIVAEKVVQCGENAVDKGLVVARKVNCVSQLIAAIVFEACCGALVGALLGALAITSHQEFPYQALIGAGGGAAIGLLLGVSRILSCRTTQVSEGSAV